MFCKKKIPAIKILFKNGHEIDIPFEKEGSRDLEITIMNNMKKTNLFDYVDSFGFIDMKEVVFIRKANIWR